MWVYSMRREQWTPGTPPTVYEDTTNVLAVVGPDTLFDEQNRKRPFSELPPGLIVLVEVGESNIPWPAPGDLDIDSEQFRGDPDSYKLGCEENAFLVAFLDGRVWLIEKPVPWEQLEKLFTVSGAEAHDREEVLKDHIIKRW